MSSNRNEDNAEMNTKLEAQTSLRQIKSNRSHLFKERPQKNQIEEGEISHWKQLWDFYVCLINY
jgi:hypothetical protein